MNNSMLTRNPHFPLPSSFLFCQNRLLRFRTKTHIVEQLRDCEDHISVISTHASLLKLGFSNDTFTTNHLMSGYVRLGRIEQAHQLFDETPEPDVASWTSLMAGYIRTGRPKVALWLFGSMAFSSVLPSAFTLSTIVKACSMLADLNTGRRVHAQVEIFGFQSNLVVCSSLIDMYGKCNDVDEARRVSI